MYFHVYLIYRFTRTFTDHSSVITRCWGFELQNGKSSLKSPQTLATQDFAPASFLSTPDILTKRYRCVWRKARRINRFRAFSGPDFFFQTIDANRCFSASAPIRTGHFPFSGRCIRPAPVFCGPEHDRSGLIFYAWEELYEHQRRRKEPLLVKITNCGRADAGISGKFNNYAIKRGGTCWKSLTFDGAEDYNSLRKAIRRWMTKARRSKVSVHSGEVSSPFAARFSHGYLFRNLEKEDAE